MYVFRRDENATTAAVELWFRAPAAGYDLATPGMSRLAIAAIAASGAAKGTSLSEQIARDGGTLSINVYPDIAMIGAEVPSWDLQTILRTITGSYFAPSITDAGYKVALRDCAVAAAEGQYDSERILQDALFARLFPSGAAHYSPVPASTQDYSKITIDQLRAFAARAFREGNAVLTITGAVGEQWQSDVRSGSLGGANRGLDAPIDSPVNSHGSDVTQPAPVSGLGFAWTGPPIADMKAATALDFVADYLFDPDHGTISRAVRAGSSDTYLNGQFITLHNPGVLLVTIGGTGASGARAKVTDAITSMSTPLDKNTFDAARNAFIYHIFSQIQTPQSRADNFGWYAAEGNLPYAPGDVSGQYLQAAQSLDAGYVAEIVRRYLQNPTVVELSAGRTTGSTS
ncbi:MAG TPA: hypothetical protein VGZ02_00110 [Candidatus Baltobacteraceae bacterium]|jgi:predicted Zn-dependent peptidase|nr:hypothetical protein [Candidatus Baltobacteraceae bacterium]